MFLRTNTLRVPLTILSTRNRHFRTMAPSVLGVGIPSSSPLVPDARREGLQKLLNVMESQMDASPYEWEMLYVDPDQPFDLITQKLQEKNWDIVMVGTGLRTLDVLIPFTEKIVNAVHEHLPKAKFAFNISIDKTEEACRRVLAP